MRYHELLEDKLGSQQTFVNSILDMLTPLASQGMEFVTVQQVINKLKGSSSGLHVDRELVMDLLDPDTFPLVKSIEGDKLYLKKLAGPDRSVSAQQKEKEQDTINKTATKQAQDNIKQ